MPGGRGRKDHDLKRSRLHSSCQWSDNRTKKIEENRTPPCFAYRKPWEVAGQRRVSGKFNAMQCQPEWPAQLNHLIVQVGVFNKTDSNLQCFFLFFLFKKSWGDYQWRIIGRRLVSIAIMMILNKKSQHWLLTDLWNHSAGELILITERLNPPTTAKKKTTPRSNTLHTIIMIPEYKVKGRTGIQCKSRTSPLAILKQMV